MNILENVPLAPLTTFKVGGPADWLVDLNRSEAVERVLAGAHFPTDVAAAALVGTALGIGIPWLHARSRAHQFSILPADGGRGLTLAGAF